MGPVYELDHLRREEHKCGAAAGPLTQPRLLVSWTFDPVRGGGVCELDGSQTL